jgi:hypothetical protein
MMMTMGREASRAFSALNVRSLSLPLSLSLLFPLARGVSLLLAVQRYRLADFLPFPLSSPFFRYCRVNLPTSHVSIPFDAHFPRTLPLFLAAAAVVVAPLYDEIDFSLFHLRFSHLGLLRFFAHKISSMVPPSSHDLTLEHTLDLIRAHAFVNVLRIRMLIVRAVNRSSLLRVRRLFLQEHQVLATR